MLWISSWIISTGRVNNHLEHFSYLYCIHTSMDADTQKAAQSNRLPSFI